MLILRWHWWRVNGSGELAAIVVSSAAAPLLLWLVEGEAVRLLLMFVLATGAGVVTSLVIGPEADDRLDEFYRRARPPGFWGPVADRNGDDARAVTRAWVGRLG